MALRPAVEPEVTHIGDGYAEAMLAAVAFRVDVAPEPDAVRVCPVGEIDMATIGRLRARMEEAMEVGTGRLILDLRQTTFLDLTGLRLTMEVAAWAARNETTFAIIAGPPAVKRTFEVAGLSASLPFVDVPRG